MEQQEILDILKRAFSKLEAYNCGKVNEGKLWLAMSEIEDLIEKLEE